MDSFSMPTIPEGTYDAIVTKVELEPPPNNYHYRWTFVFLHNGRINLITGMTGAKLTPESDLYQWTSGAVGSKSFPHHESYFKQELVRFKRVKIVIQNKILGENRHDWVDCVLPYQV